MKIGTNVTSLLLAVEKSSSSRTTVPVSVAYKLDLKKSDRIERDFDKVDGGWMATVRKRAE